MVKQLLGLILDVQKPKPSFSKTLLELDNAEGATSNLLPLAAATLGDATLISKTSRRLGDGGENAANIRALFASILEDTFILSEHYRWNKMSQWPQ